MLYPESFAVVTPPKDHYEEPPLSPVASVGDHDNALLGSDFDPLPHNYDDSFIFSNRVMQLLANDTVIGDFHELEGKNMCLILILHSLILIVVQHNR